MSVQNQYVTTTIGPTAQVGAATAFTWSWTNQLPGKWYIESASLVPDENQTANGTNNSVYTLARNGASVGSRSYASGNSTAGTPEPLTLTEAQRELSQGDELTWAKTVNGTGLAGTNRVDLVLRRIA
jgi:hypothetical protein